MSETPRKVWLADYELDDAATWELDEGVQYIRADIVDELLEKIEKILVGIDKEQIDSDDGYWETSYGADYGKERLELIRAEFAALAKARGEG